jgi:UDP-3-O-[3-hydroxymyristoyl] glucosamine N-acyltransferase
MSEGTTERFALRSAQLLATLVPEATAATDARVSGFSRFGHGGAGDLCFCDRTPADTVRVSAGAMVLCTPDLLPLLRERFPQAVSVALPDPRAAFIDAGHRLLASDGVEVTAALPRPFGTHPSARIGPGTFIHPETRIDEGCTVGANCVIHRGSWIQAGTMIRDNTVVGTEGINASRGADGRQRNFPHLAGVLIGPGTEIGAGAVVVRGIVDSTRIGRGVVIGNLCNIGHVVHVGDKVWMSVGCLVGGHTDIGQGATLGMGVSVKDNVRIGSNAQVGMGSVVVKDVAEGSSVFGNPARFMGAIQAGPAR